MQPDCPQSVRAAQHRAARVFGKRERERESAALTLEEAEVAVDGGLDGDIGGGGGHGGGDPGRKVLPCASGIGFWAKIQKILLIPSCFEP